MSDGQEYYNWLRPRARPSPEGAGGCADFLRKGHGVPRVTMIFPYLCFLTPIEEWTRVFWTLASWRSFGYSL